MTVATPISPMMTQRRRFENGMERWECGLIAQAWLQTRISGLRDEVLPHRREDIDEDAVFARDHAMDHISRDVIKIAGLQLLGLVANVRGERARLHIRDLQVRMLMQGADRALLELHVHGHEFI